MYTQKLIKIVKHEIMLLCNINNKSYVKEIILKEILDFSQH